MCIYTHIIYIYVCICTHTHSLSLSLSLSRTHTHTHTPSLSLSLSLTHTHLSPIHIFRPLRSYLSCIPCRLYSHNHPCTPTTTLNS